MVTSSLLGSQLFYAAHVNSTQGQMRRTDVVVSPARNATVRYSTTVCRRYVCMIQQLDYHTYSICIPYTCMHSSGIIYAVENLLVYRYLYACIRRRSQLAPLTTTRGKQAAAPQQQSSDADSGEQGDHPGVSACPLLCTTFLRHIMSSAPPPPAPPRRDWRNMTRTLAHYERIEQIGEGTYGQVYRAKCLDTGRIVALKKIRVHHGGYWGMPPTVIREIKILKKLQHPNLVEMLEVVSSKGVEYLEEDDEAPRQSKNSSNRIVDAREGFKGNIYLVLEYVSHDLTGLMDVAYRFTEQQIKCIFQQLLQALQYMHSQKFIHRDIKSSNILIDSHFCVKLADFGLSRSIEPPILENIHE